MKGICFLCGNYEQLEEHHIFGGARRPISTKYGLTVQLCPWCHRIDADSAGDTRTRITRKKQRSFFIYLSPPKTLYQKTEAESKTKRCNGRG